MLLLSGWNAAFIKVLKEDFPSGESKASKLAFYMVVREKGYIMAFYEIVYRRLSV